MGRTYGVETDFYPCKIDFVQDLMPGIEVILGKKGHFWLESSFTSLDEKYVLVVDPPNILC